MLREMSSAMTECVRAPEEMYVTPVCPISCTVASVTFPLASVSTRPAMNSTAAFMSVRLMLSSMTRVTAPVSNVTSSMSAITCRTSSMVRVSTSIGAVNFFSARKACALATALSMPPDAAMWLSLIMIMSKRPMRWFFPPPMSTAHLSGRRRPGTVLRVSNMNAGAAWSAICLVSVAMPLMRCMKLSTTRSARRMLCALPRISQKSSPLEMVSPSNLLHDTSRLGSTAARIWFASACPASTPSALASSVARDTVSAGMVLSELMSPTSAMSSSSASLMASAMLYVGCDGTATLGASLAASDAFIMAGGAVAAEARGARARRGTTTRREVGARERRAPEARALLIVLPGKLGRT
mmetsp:Transcript_29166/g.72824  ORF Transcript_29166/g.72824 Transcript_29166/m.72824 type:complete len:353 (-) Transcript_29166:29-1087(-)